MIEHYQSQAALYAARRERAAALSARVSRLRLATFLPGAALLILSLSRDVAPLPLAAGVALLAGFAALVVRHARIEERVAWFDALRDVNLVGVARIGRAWDRLPPAQAPAEPTERHPYARDLDLFGRASLFHWLGPAATAPGTDTLQQWLLEPAAPAEIHRRHPAVAELAAAVEWRERLAAHGAMTAGVGRVELERFLQWAEGGAPFSPAGAQRLKIAVGGLSSAIWALAALEAAGAVGASVWLVPVAAGTVLSFATARYVHGEFDRAGAGQRALTRYAALFAHACDAPAGAELLGSIRTRLGGRGSTAHERLRRLNRILGFSELRTGAAILHFPIQALTMWDFHVYFALERWRREAGGAVRAWMQALGELDALSSLARIKADNPAWCLPDVTGAHAALVCEQLGHPLLHDERRVDNDVTVGPPGTVLLITGSNMSGKSTLLRAIGLNAVLAQAGAPVCALRMAMPPVDLEASLRVQDSLEHGLSYFMAALARLKGVVDRSRGPRHGRILLYLLDEILQGTNTAERGLAVRGVATHLLASGAIGVMTTHDLALASEEPLRSAARLVHFTEAVDEQGGMTFDYRLRPGLATSRNALRLMQLIGIDLDGLVRRADDGVQGEGEAERSPRDGPRL